MQCFDFNIRGQRIVATKPAVTEGIFARSSEPTRV